MYKPSLPLWTLSPCFLEMASYIENLPWKSLGRRFPCFNLKCCQCWFTTVLRNYEDISWPTYCCLAHPPDDQTPCRGTAYFCLGDTKLDSPSLSESRSLSWIQANKEIQKSPITETSRVKTMYFKMKCSHFTVRLFHF